MCFEFTKIRFYRDYLFFKPQQQKVHKDFKT
jgi:hypothetical protein